MDIADLQVRTCGGIQSPMTSKSYVARSRCDSALPRVSFLPWSLDIVRRRALAPLTTSSCSSNPVRSALATVANLVGQLPIDLPILLRKPLDLVLLASALLLHPAFAFQSLPASAKRTEGRHELLSLTLVQLAQRRNFFSQRNGHRQGAKYRHRDGNDETNLRRHHGSPPQAVAVRRSPHRRQSVCLLVWIAVPGFAADESRVHWGPRRRPGCDVFSSQAHL